MITTIRDANRTHVPELEQRAINQKPKDNSHTCVTLYRYEDSSIYQWWSYVGGSVFMEPFSEPFVMVIDERDGILTGPKDSCVMLGFSDEELATLHFLAASAAMEPETPVAMFNGWSPERRRQSEWLWKRFTKWLPHNRNKAKP